MTEHVTLPREELQALFDLAVNSMDFGSGFWDTEETNAARRVALRLGVDPIKATPSDHVRNYPHAYEEAPELHWRTKGPYCRTCRQPAHGDIVNDPTFKVIE